MREAGEGLLQKDVEAGRFTSLDATAEATGIQDDSVDLILAGQAFHWFDVPRTRAECLRILKKGGHSGVALVWNDRRGVQDAPQRLAAAGEDINQVDYDRLDSPVTSAYELLLVKRGTDYKNVDHHRTVDKKALDAFFGPKGFKVKSFENPYKLTYDQLKGRLQSSSYTPQEGEEGHDVMMRELQELFDKFQKDGKVDFIYDTRVFYGELSE
jgi:SAM-dependent methyltransferase